MPKSALGSTAKERVLAAASLSKKQAEREREHQAERLEEQQRRTEELRQAVIQNMSTPASRRAVYANARALDSNPALLGRTRTQNQLQTEADRIRDVQQLALSRASTQKLEGLRDELVDQASGIDPNVDPARYDTVAERGRMVQDALDQRYSQDYENAPFQWKAGQNVGYVANRAAAGLLGALEGVADAGVTALADERYGKIVPGIGLAQSIANLAGRGDTFRDAADKALTISPTNDYRQYIEENYTPGTISRGVGELADTATNMAPSIAANIVLPGSGLPLMALQSGGASAQEAYQNGATLEQASTYGLASGALEAGTEMMFGGLAGLGRGVLDTGVGNVVNQAIGRLGGTKAGQVMSRLAQNSLVKALADSAGEGVEEVVSTVISPYLQRAIYDPDAENASAEEIVQSALLGAAAGGVFQGLGAIARRVGADPGSNVPRETATIQRQDRGMLVPSGRTGRRQTGQSAADPESFIRNELSTGRKSAEQISKSVQNRYQGSTASSALNGMMQSGEVAVDASGNFYARDPNSHIDNRDMGTVGSRSVNAFQFDNPSLHEYYVGAAQDLLTDLADSIPADRFPVERMNPDTGMVETVWTGNKRYTTDQISSLLDDQKLTYNDIQKAAQAIIENHGQENYAAAKRVELVLDDMLANGWRDMTGYYHEPNQDYIRMKREIPGAYIPEETADYDRLADIDPLPDGVTLESEVPPVVQRLSQALGRNIQMYDGSRESGTRGTANGYYSNGTIYVNSNTANPVAQVIAHELTHSVEMADAYQDLQNLIFERIQQTGGNLEQMRAQKADLYQRNGVNLNAQDLDAEIVAEYVEKNLLTDESSIQELTRTNRTLAQRIRDWIDSILAKLGNTDAQSRVFLERARDAYSRALQQTQGTVDTVATVDAVGSVASQRQVRSLLDQYDSGAITQDQLIEQAARLLEGEADEQYSVSYDSSGNVNPKYSISEYTDQERQDHARTVLDHFGKTYSWNETGYITQDGSRVDLSGKHEGGPGGYRAVDHRDISDALGWDYGGGDYSGAMVQFISEGNIRISPESGGIDLSVQPTRAQERSLEGFISRNRGEVILDIDTPDGNTVASVEYPKGTHSSKVISDIRNYFADGTIPQVSEVSRFRYSLDENQRNQFISMLREYARGNWNEQTIQEYLNLVRQNGEYDQGANAARPVLVPQRDSEGNPVSRTARTVMGAKAIPESVASDIANLVRAGQMSYERVGDKASTQRAIQRIENDGFDRSLEYFSQNVRKGIASKDMVTLGQQLLVNAANAGDGRRTAEILQLYTQMGTSIGQAEQAFSILRKLDPSDQLYAIQKTVSNLEEEIQKRFKDKNITIDPALLEEFQNQTDDAGRDAVKEKIYQNVADQIPSNWRDKWNAWRYMAMLVNPRTHIRNAGGNLLFQPVRITKDRVAAGLEKMASVIDPDFQRTKSFVASPGLYKAAWNDWKNVKDVLSGNKYDDIGSEINRRRTIFQSRVARPLELARRGNSAALEYEDAVFKRFTYADALAGYLQANGVTAEQMDSGQVDKNLLAKARDYAGQEALKATYQDRNQFSDLISSRFREGTTAAKVANTAIDAVLPFRRTPANILVRGFEYSPAGLIKSLTSDLLQVKRGNMSGAEAIDHIAAGLTGSGLFALGAWLLSEGLVTSGGSDDQEQEDLNALTGKQNYALNLPGGGSVTLDWLAPEALPFFMGVEFMEALGEGGFDLETVTDALSSISEPMLELSMLQSLNDLIDSVSYAESSEKMVSMAGSALVSYLTQAIPTLGGQIERTTESDRMSSFTDRNSSVPRDLQYALSRASARLPGDYQQIPYIDAWGRTESNGGLLSNAFANFLNPAYTSQTNETAADQEIQRLLDAGQTGVVPDRVSQSQKVDGKYLSADQYVQYATTKGQTSYDIVSEMIDSDLYQGMTDEEKANAIKRAYQYAGHIAAEEINQEHESEAYVANAKNAQTELGVSAGEYLLLYGKYGSNKMSRLSELVQDGMSLDDAEHLVGEKNYGSSDIKEYNEFVSAGLSDSDAESLVDALASLEPAEGSEDVSSLQKYRAVLDTVSGDENQMSALSQVMSDSEYEKLSTGNSYGVSPSAYVDFKERVTQYDADGNGSLKQSEVEAALDSYGGGLTLPGDTRVTLTNDQKAILWQLQGKGWSPKNNPYNTRIGQQVYDALHGEADDGPLPLELPRG